MSSELNSVTQAHVSGADFVVSNLADLKKATLLEQLLDEPSLLHVICIPQCAKF